MTKDYEAALRLIDAASNIAIIQAENPDADSLGSALALEQLLGDAGKTITMCCSTDVPRHLRYLSGWDRVVKDLPEKFDLTIIVDNPAQLLLEAFLTTENAGKISQKPMLVIDHHGIDITIEHPNRTDLVDGMAVATGEMIYQLAKEAKWSLDEQSGRCIVAAIMSDSLGLSTDKTTARSIYTIAELVEAGYVNLAELDQARREYGKKSIGIIAFKAKLLQRIEYYLDNRLAFVSITQDEIKEYSDKYNPSMLVLEELRNAEDVDLMIVLKVYDDRVTGKLRSNYSPLCNQIATKFHGGGHPYAAGFKIKNKSHDDVKKEAIALASKLLESKS